MRIIMTEEKDTIKIGSSDIVTTVPNAAIKIGPNNTVTAAIKIEPKDTITAETGIAAKMMPNAPNKVDAIDVKAFAGIPIEHLICDPIIAVAKGQAALCEVYLDNVYKLAYKNYKDAKPGELPDDKTTNTVDFILERPVTCSPNDPSAPKTESVKVTAPLISLVPVPAFTMDEVTVQFTMEVKEQITDTTSAEATASLEVGGSYWGFTAKITGSVTAKSSHTRTSDQSAKYDIFARAVQQPPAEGMAKLTSLFASIIEPIPIQKGN